MLSTTATPLSASAARMPTTLAALELSSPEVGSSRYSTAGCVSSSAAMLSRRFSPPDSPRWNWSPTRLPASCAIPSAARMLATRTCPSSRATLRGSRRAAWNAMYSITVEVPGNTSSCGTYPDSERSSRGSAARPFTSTTPRTSHCEPGRPAKMSSSVVLPAPEGPRMAAIPLPVESPSEPARPDTWVRTLRLGALDATARSVHVISNQETTTWGVELAQAGMLMVLGCAEAISPRRRGSVMPRESNSSTSDAAAQAPHAAARETKWVSAKISELFRDACTLTRRNT